MFSSFNSIPKLRYGFSTRHDGNLRIPSSESDTEANRKRYIESLGLDPMRFVSGELVHGTHVHIAREEEAGSIIPACDGFVTNIPNLALSVTGADCFPVYAIDPVERVIGMAHAGWRGITSGIIPELITQMNGLGSESADILIGIGPGIRACHFEIHEDVFSHFEGHGDAVIEREEGMFVDLPAIIKKQLKEAGILPEHVSDSEECTYHLEEKYFSRRRDQAGPLQAMMAYILLEK
ncbi:peptidoglycan editing factor PgeF [Candidatus Uhrbacteria bacterium]|nr:peptidoglycan editing factor PgeF [Candidatus Uhrbacteria bacterium]